MIIFYIITLFLLVTLTIVIYNFFYTPLLNGGQFNEFPFVSILIPARNEENNISRCLNYILKLNYSNYEVLVLDDESTDNTRTLVEDFCKQDNRIKLIAGKTLPQNWKGKNWSCHQLSENAKGEFLLFLDADVIIAADSLSKALKTMLLKNVSLLTLFPTQKICSLGEYIIVPLMNWLLLSFLPLKFVYSKKNISFSAANGQYMLWKKNIYFAIGGHKSVSDKIVEDIELARLVKKSGFGILTGLGNGNVFCRMYGSLSEGFNGFSKNFFPGFNIHPVIFLFMISSLFMIYTLPFYLIFHRAEFIIPLMIIIIQRLLIALKSNQNFFYNIILHPLQMFMMLFTGINSVISSYRNKLTWKGRQI